MNAMNAVRHGGISGKKKIHVKMLNMIDEAQKTVYVLTTGLGVIQEDIGGVFRSGAAFHCGFGEVA